MATDSSGTGDYILHAQRLNNPGNATPIAFGQTLSGAIATPIDISAYTFSATSNDTVLVRMTRISDTLVSSIRIMKPDGTQACLADRSFFVEIGGCVLLSSGNYTILASATDRASIGTFTIYTQRRNNPGNAIPIGYGDLVSGEISSPTAMNTYTFTAEGDDNVIVRMARTSDTLVPSIQINKFDGTVPCYADRNSTVQIGGCRLLSGGKYTILAYSTDSNNFGKYDLFIQRFNNPIGAIPIRFGQTLSGSIRPSILMNTYSFDVVGDAQVNVRMTRTSGTFLPSVGIIPSDGVQICYGDRSPSAEIGNCTLRSAGKYSIFAYATDIFGTGDYTLSLQCLNAPCSINSDLTKKIYIPIIRRR